MVKNYDNMLSRFHIIPERYGQTDRITISISRVSMLTRDKNRTVSEIFSVKNGVTLKPEVRVVQGH